MSETLQQQLEALLANPDDFAAWLQSRPDGEPAGIANTHWGCPAACWLEYRLGMEIRVDYERIEDDHAMVVARTPGWLLAFATRIDKLGDGTDVSKADAIAVLRRAREVQL